MNLEEQAKQRLEEYRNSKIDTWMADFGELARYRAANAALPAAAAGESRVVFMGDSITDAWQLAEYFPGKPYINRGIGGQTTPQMLIRFRPDAILQQPKLVVVLAGTNDIAGNTGPMALEDTEHNLASMAELAQVHGIGVVLASVLPVHNHAPGFEARLIGRPPGKILELNRWIGNYCAWNHYVYLDYFSVMVDADGLLQRHLADDGLHPTPAGYKLMAPLAENAITQALSSTGKLK
jgi:lysophospholipase L1-like esterase